jgi:hypothetical protein
MTDHQPTDVSPEELKAYIRRLEDTLSLVRRRLKRYEDEFGMKSKDFYQLLLSGQLHNRADFAEWVSEHERYSRLAEQIDELKLKLPR